MKKYGILILVAVLIAGFSSCATIFTGTTQNVNFDSNQKGAIVRVNGQPVGSTPCNVSVKKSSKATIHFSKEGYEDNLVELKGRFNATSLLGILLDWGIISIPTDFITGAAWKYSNTSVYAQLIPTDKDIVQKTEIIDIPIYKNNTKTGNELKVAVYVTGAEGDGINEFIGAYLVDAIVNGSNYLAVERTADFIRELNKEQEYQRTGSVNDDQISQLGQQFGVQLVCVAKVGKVGHRQFVSARLIDVETATVKNSTKPVLFTMDDIDKSCAAVAVSLVSGESVNIKRPN